MSDNDQEMRINRQVIAIRKQPAKADPIDNTTPKTPKSSQNALKESISPGYWKLESPRKQPTRLHHPSPPGEHNYCYDFGLLPQPKPESVPKNKSVTAGTQVTLEKIRITQASVFPGLQHRTG